MLIVWGWRINTINQAFKRNITDFEKYWGKRLMIIFFVGIYDYINI